MVVPYAVMLARCVRYDSLPLRNSAIGSVARSSPRRFGRSVDGLVKKQEVMGNSHDAAKQKANKGQHR